MGRQRRRASPAPARSRSRGRRRGRWSRPGVRRCGRLRARARWRAAGRWRGRLGAGGHGSRVERPVVDDHDRERAGAGSVAQGGQQPAEPGRPVADRDHDGDVGEPGRARGRERRSRRRAAAPRAPPRWRPGRRAGRRRGARGPGPTAAAGGAENRPGAWRRRRAAGCAGRAARRTRRGADQAVEPAGRGSSHRRPPTGDHATSSRSWSRSWARTAVRRRASVPSRPTAKATRTPRLANAHAPVVPPRPNGPEQVALPVEPAGVGVGDQAPAQDGAGHEQDQRNGLHAAVAAARIEQVGLGVVALPQRQVGQEDAAPGRDRDAERDQEALELEEEVAGEEDDGDRAQRP